MKAVFIRVTGVLWISRYYLFQKASYLTGEPEKIVTIDKIEDFCSLLLCAVTRYLFSFSVNSF
jgi:hypothetical protein